MSQQVSTPWYRLVWVLNHNSQHVPGDHKDLERAGGGPDGVGGGHAGGGEEEEGAPPEEVAHPADQGRRHELGCNSTDI